MPKMSQQTSDNRTTGNEDISQALMKEKKSSGT